MLTIRAPAKINLTLEVLGKRDDGYHEITSVIQTISLYDVLHIKKSSATEIQADLPGWQPEKSLLPEAVRLLRDAAGFSCGVNITLEKHIPMIAGLGGESSDTAAVLWGLNRLLDLDLPMEKLADIAARLGSDVTFFLHNGTALMEGRGEKITPLPALPEFYVVLVMPPVSRLPGKTAQQYNSLKTAHYTEGIITSRLAAALKEGRNLSTDILFNTFENLAFQSGSGIDACRRLLMQNGADNVHLAGSGPTLFTLFRDRAPAVDFHHRIKNQLSETHFTRTVSG